MRCPYCGNPDNRVVDSRLGRDETEIRRRRECLECRRRFTTRERVEDVLPKIAKRDGRHEEYDRQKLVAGIQKACAKRPFAAEQVERLAGRVERRLQELGEPEVASAFVGEWVLEELGALDAMAAARFASVFRGFESAADYAAFFRALGERPAGRSAGGASEREP